ncbi:MAG: SH3 domain-containing protein [Synergistaceae bacterium]|nr:SH3 domain-containing protein [Synergistaceae bacterium]
MKENNPYYARAESELPRVWDELKSSLSVQAFDELKQEKLAWMTTERDKEAEGFLERGYSRAEAYTFVTEECVKYLRGKLQGKVKYSVPLFASAAYAHGDGGQVVEVDNEAISSYGIDVEVIHGNVINNALNVRNKPGVNSSRVIYQLDNGEDIYVHKVHKVNGADWYYVSAAFEREGWVSGRYIQLDSPSSASEDVASNLPSVSTDTNIASTDNPSGNLNEPHVVASKDMGSDPNFDLADKLVGEGKIPMYVRDKGKFICDPNFKYVHVTGSTVNLRSQPNTKGQYFR